MLVRASLTSCTKQTQTEEIILMFILKIFSATKKLKILAAGESEVMEQRNQKTAQTFFSLFNCCFWSFSSQLKTINDDWISSEKSEVALWGHVSQGNLRLRD